MTENGLSDHSDDKSHDKEKEKTPRLSKQVHRGRFPLIDLTRGFAVLLMIIFHFSYDLAAFHYVEINFLEDRFWWLFPRVIVFLFLYAMGQSLELVHRKSIHWKKVSKRFLKIGFFALCISGYTYFAFPDHWIYFGTLHCIAICSLLVLPFVNRPKLTVLAGLAILLPLTWGFEYPWIKMSHAAMDYIPVLPWIGVVFLGQYSLHQGLHSYDPPNFPGRRLLTFFGKYSLRVYLLHQPILFGLVKGFHYLTH